MFSRRTVSWTSLPWSPEPGYRPAFDLYQVPDIALPISKCRAGGSKVWEFAMAFFDGHFRSLLVIHTIVVCILLGVAVVMMR
jgi:hypothetical protein